MEISEESCITLTSIQETILKNNEKAVTSFLLDGQIDNGVYVDDMKRIFCFHTDSQGEAFSCVLQDNSVICAISKRKDGIEEIINGNDVEKNKTIDLNNKGERWEGDCYHGIPFGFGTFWNEDNHCTYKGYHFGESHFGYGVKYFNQYVKEYDGYWCAGMRHGEGTLRDGKENLIRSGVWMNDQAPVNTVHLENKEEFIQITNQLEEIELDNFCCKNVMNFCLISVPRLQKVKIGKGCFCDQEWKRHEFFQPATEEEVARFGKVCFRSCPLLHDIQFIPTIFNNMLSCEFSDLPSLETLLIRDQSFYKCHSMYFGNLTSLVTLTINNSFRFLKKAVIEKLPKLKEFSMKSSIHGDVPFDEYNDDFIEYPNELIIRDLPSFEKLNIENGDLFDGFGIVKIENVSDFECKSYYGFYHCYNYEVKNANTFEKLIEERAPHLYLHYSKPFDVNALPTTITSLNVGRLAGNEQSFTKLTISNFPELTDITVDCYAFSYVKDFTIEDCDKLQHFTAKKNTILMSVFTEINSHFIIRRCKQLESVYFGPCACGSYGHFSVSECPSLKTLEFFRHSFGYAQEFILKDLPMLTEVVLNDSNFYDSEITLLENLPSLEYFGIGYGSLWGGNTENKENFHARLIMKNLPKLTKMNGLADGCFDYVESFEFENIPSVTDIIFYGGLKNVKEIKATNADVIRDYFEEQRNRGY